MKQQQDDGENRVVSASTTTKRQRRLIRLFLLTTTVATTAMIASPNLVAAAWTAHTRPRRRTFDSRPHQFATMQQRLGDLMLAYDQRRRRHNHHRLFLQQQQQQHDETSAEPSRRRRRMGATKTPTTLAIIPPGDAWDRIQRARHVAGDPTYTIWPPAIRLFSIKNEQSDDVALRIAKLLEEHDVSAFDVCFDQWVIYPVITKADRQQARQQQQEQQSASTSPTTAQEIQDLRIQKLIAREEALGRENKKRRLERLERLKAIQDREETQSDEETTDNQDEPVVAEAAIVDSEELQVEPKEVEAEEEPEEPKIRIVDPNWQGRCIVALEPDQASFAAIRKVQKLLLDDPQLYPLLRVPTSGTPRQPNNRASAFAPIIPISTCPSLSEAIRAARRASESWYWQVAAPEGLLEESDEELGFTDLDSYYEFDESADQESLLDFPVTDLHIVSRQSRIDNDEGGTYQDILRTGIPASTWKQRTNDADDVEQVGCDAMIMLVDEEPDEINADLDLIQDFTKLLCEQGERGGFERVEEGPQGVAKAASENVLLLNDQLVENVAADDDDEGITELKQWLNEEDEEYDQGTVVVIGRTFFFSGETRYYVGMPAFSNKVNKGRPARPARRKKTASVGSRGR